MNHSVKHPSIDSYLQKIQHLITAGAEKNVKWHVENDLHQTQNSAEFCTNASLHRGFYHPSPIYDIVVGNTTRGRLHKKKPDPLKITHRFLSGQDGLLDCVETYSKGQVVYVEHLYYSGYIRLGVTIDKHNRISTVCEEKFERDRLVDLFVMNCVLIDEKYTCYSARSEHYSYDELGLCECDFDVISPASGEVLQKKYIFSREKGLLTSYTDAMSKQNDVYVIKKKRQA